MYVSPAGDNILHAQNADINYLDLFQTWGFALDMMVVKSLG